MKSTLLLVLLLSPSWGFAITKNSPYQHGTVVRMRMADCMSSHHFMAALSGSSAPQVSEACPEYTLLTEKVVYVIVGKSSDQLIPLAETIDFHLQKNELAVRVDDSNKESRFSIKAMALRSEWKESRPPEDEELTSWVRQHTPEASSSE